MSYCLIPNLTSATVWQSVTVMRFLQLVPGVWKKQTYLRNHSHSLDCSHVSVETTKYIKVKSRQRSGTEAIRTQLQRSKPKREITNITNTQTSKRTHSQPSEQLFPKRWPLSNRYRTKNNINTRKVKRHRNSDTKTGNREPQQKYRIGTVSNELLGGGA